MKNVRPVTDFRIPNRNQALMVEFLKLKWVYILLALGILFLVFFNLTSYPLTWFDEGSHLHVPKTLVNFGVYADRSSEGFRYYGPTSGVGPTVFLPIALVFRVLGIGLLQARLVMALYLLAAIFIFFRLARWYGGLALAGVATALVVTSRGVAMLEYGREVLGEVPGFFFMAAGLVLWFSTWEKPDWRKLTGAGLLLGLSLVTKNQYLIVLAPGLGLVFLANWLYYKAVQQRIFLVTGTVAFLCYLIWQAIQVFSLGPATASQNLALFRQATAESALIFSPALMKLTVSNLLALKVYLGFLVPALVYGLVLSLPRGRDGLRWSVLFFLAFANLAWYCLASIGWLRYAFPALAFSGILLAKLFSDLTAGFQVNFSNLWQSIRRGEGVQVSDALRAVFLAWLALMILLPLAQDVKDILRPPFNAPQAMAAYMNANVDKNALVETWEPEMGFLTDHNYHFPPQALLYAANSFIWMGKTSPSAQYDYVQENVPEYVLTGAFSNWVQLYPTDFLAAHYQLDTTIGGYHLYVRK